MENRFVHQEKKNKCSKEGLPCIKHKCGPIPVKYKDPESPTISCIIGQTIINRALLDLGASINLLPFFVYQ